MAETPSVDALIATAAAGWGYAESTHVDGWHLRAAEGFSRRLSSAARYVGASGSWPTTAATPGRIAKYRLARPTFMPMSQTTTGRTSVATSSIRW